METLVKVENLSTNLHIEACKPVLAKLTLASWKKMIWNLFCLWLKRQSNQTAGLFLVSQSTPPGCNGSVIKLQRTGPTQKTGRNKNAATSARHRKMNNANVVMMNGEGKGWGSSFSIHPSPLLCSALF